MRTSELLDSHIHSVIQKQTKMLFKLLEKKQPAQHFDFQNTKLTVPLPNRCINFKQKSTCTSPRIDLMKSSCIDWGWPESL